MVLPWGPKWPHRSPTHLWAGSKMYMYTHIINNHTYGSDLSMTSLSYGSMDNHNWMISSIILITVFPPSNSRRKAHTIQLTSLMLQSTFPQKVRYTLAYTPSQRTHITILVISLISHPPNCKDSIPYSQFLRGRRLCSRNNDFVTESRKMVDYFRRAGYPKKLLQEAFGKVFKLDRC